MFKKTNTFCLHLTWDLNPEHLGCESSMLTIVIKRIRNLSYERRLKHLKLHSLERCRVRGDMIEILKWVKGFNKGDVGKVLTISSQDRTRSQGFKLEKCRFSKEIGRNWFTNRVVDDWNRLSHQVVSAQTIGSFKR